MHALAALTTLLRITLGDDSAPAEPAADGADARRAQPTLDDVPRLLSEMFEQHGGSVEAASSSNASTHVRPTAPAADMRVHRTDEWARSVAEKLGVMLPPLFSVLCRHTRSSVRAGAARAAAELLAHCSRSVGTCTRAWLECLLCLAHDPWPQVALAASAALGTLELADERAPAAASSRALLGWPQLQAVLFGHLDAFAQACSRGESEAIAASHLLAGAIVVAGPSRVAASVLMSPARRQQLCHQLTRAFSLSSALRALPGATVVASAANVTVSTDGALFGAGLLPKRHSRLAILSSDEVRAQALFTKPLACLMR